MVKTRSSARLAGAANNPPPAAPPSSTSAPAPKRKTHTKKTNVVAPTLISLPAKTPVSVINHTSGAAPHHQHQQHHLHSFPEHVPSAMIPPAVHLPPLQFFPAGAGPSDLDPSYMLDALKAGGYPVHPDVKFRRLPFFQETGEVMRPSSLLPTFSSKMQESTFHFHLTPQQVQTVMNSPELNSIQVLLRLCTLEPVAEQDDCFPPHCAVKVNNKACALPMPIPSNKPGVEPRRPPCPLNITALLKLSPTVANTVVITWSADFLNRYAVNVILVRRVSSSLLLSRLKNKVTKNADFTRSLIKEKLREDLDCEIATTSLRVSLVCPLGKMRMVCPCRPATCSHLQCFDASLFLQMNERKTTWICPVCDKTALYDNLVIDGYFQEVLNSPRLSEDCTEIQLHKDGSWSAHNKTDIIPEKALNDIEVIQDDMDIIPLSDGSESSTGPPSSKRRALSRDEFPNQPSPEPRASAPVPAMVDLTSDSEDDLPLRRKVPGSAPKITSEHMNETIINMKRNISLDLAVSSIISLDSPSPLADNDPPMEVEALDPTMDLDDPDETNEALKQISTADDNTASDLLPLSTLPMSSFEIHAPLEFSEETKTDDSQGTEDKDPAEDPVAVDSAVLQIINTAKDGPSTEEPTVTPVSIPGHSQQMGPLDSPIDDTPPTLTQTTDPLEIEEPLSNVTGDTSSPILTADQSNVFTFEDDTNESRKNTEDSSGKPENFYSNQVDITFSDPLRNEQTAKAPSESKKIPQAIVAPYQPDPQPDYQP